MYFQSAVTKVPRESAVTKVPQSSTDVLRTARFLVDIDQTLPRHHQEIKQQQQQQQQQKQRVTENQWCIIN